MLMDKVAGSGNDEFYTPLYAVKPIIKYIDKAKKVWCPFDTLDSMFVKYLRQQGYEVVNSHIEYGTDFFNCKIPDCDIIVSNPPYSMKNQVFERLYEIGKPFAMLVGVVGLFESRKRFEMFRDNSFEIMYLDKRVAYFSSYYDDTPKLSPPFSSVYVCNDVLPNKIIFEEINKKELKC